MGPLIYCEFVHYEQGIPGNQNAEARIWRLCRRHSIHWGRVEAKIGKIK
jgi:hypothetical protein